MSSIKDPDRYLPERQKNMTEKGWLYLVGTPIGNLSDISERALKVLSDADFIAAEDTRNSGRLLSHFGISKPMVSYFEHNKRERGEYIVQRISGGETCALITDAGMPAISDPGEDIVALCAEKGIPVSVIPGPSASVSALAVSGLPTSRFVFEGFLPTAKGALRERLAEIKREKRTVIIYEAPHRIAVTLSELYSELGDRRVSLCRELTKLNEEIIRTDLRSASSLYADTAPRGEFVIILEGARDARTEAFWEGMSEEEHVAYYRKSGMEQKEAIKAAARDRGVPKNEIYAKIMKKD